MLYYASAPPARRPAKATQATPTKATQATAPRRVALFYGHPVDPLHEQRPAECSLTDKRGAPCRTPASIAAGGTRMCEAHHGSVIRAHNRGEPPWSSRLPKGTP